MRRGSIRKSRRSVALTLVASSAVYATAAEASATLSQADGRAGGTIGTGADKASVDRFSRNRNIAVQQRPRPDYEARGGRFGLVMAYPRIEIAAEHSDNIFATAQAPSGDAVVHIRPELSLEVDGPRHFVSAYVRGALNRHRRFSSEDTDDYGFGGSVRVDVRRLSALSAGADFNRASEPRTSPGAPSAAVSPIRFETASAYVAAAMTSGRIKLTARSDLRSLDYADGLDRTGRVIDQDARDREVGSLLGRIDAAASPDAAVFFQATANRRDYDRSEASGRPPRSSQGVEYLAGANFEVSALVRGEVAVGYIKQDFDDPTYDDAARFGGRAQLDYFLSPLTTLTLGAGRTVEDAATPGAGGYVASSASLTLDHELLRNLILTARLTYSKDEYQGLDRNDRRLQARVGATYLVNRNLGVSLVAATLKTSSDGVDRDQDFTVNRLTLSLVTQF